MLIKIKAQAVGTFRRCVTRLDQVTNSVNCHFWHKHFRLCYNLPPFISLFKQKKFKNNSKNRKGALRYFIWLAITWLITTTITSIILINLKETTNRSKLAYFFVVINSFIYLFFSLNSIIRISFFFFVAKWLYKRVSGISREIFCFILCLALAFVFNSLKMYFLSYYTLRKKKKMGRRRRRTQRWFTIRKTRVICNLVN